MILPSGVPQVQNLNGRGPRFESGFGPRVILPVLFCLFGACCLSVVTVIRLVQSHQGTGVFHSLVWILFLFRIHLKTK
ncbi:hypothetical protein BJY04DRAFT_177205 [Aspergillus karnatakaensis]|uniref:uncharacterized protein n=1 Tax=Aspergillus karnatakaensis TaxID=1810916 RepID=UPI003CCD6598